MGKRRGELDKDKTSLMLLDQPKTGKNKCRALNSWLQFLCTRLLWFDNEAGIGWTKQRVDWLHGQVSWWIGC